MSPASYTSRRHGKINVINISWLKPDFFCYVNGGSCNVFTGSPSVVGLQKRKKNLGMYVSMQAGMADLLKYMRVDND